MGCKVNYPDEKCPFGFEGRVTRDTCGACKNFTPPQFILSWCMLYDRTGTVCRLPKKACDSCNEKHPHGPGRPAATSEVDWTDPKSVRAYWRKRAGENPDARTAAMRRFLEKNPDYFAKYRESNREKMRAASRRHYQKKREERNAEQRTGEVRPDPHGPRSERDEDLPAPGSDDAV